MLQRKITEKESWTLGKNLEICYDCTHWWSGKCPGKKQEFRKGKPLIKSCSEYFPMPDRVENNSDDYCLHMYLFGDLFFDAPVFSRIKGV